MSKTRKTSLILNVVLAAVLIYLLCLFIHVTVKGNAMKNDKKKIDNDIVAAQTENQKLSDILDAQIDEAYVEKVARDMGYVMSDEKVYQSITD